MSPGVFDAGVFDSGVFDVPGVAISVGSGGMAGPVFVPSRIGFRPVEYRVPLAGEVFRGIEARAFLTGHVLGKLRAGAVLAGGVTAGISASARIASGVYTPVGTTVPLDGGVFKTTRKALLALMLDEDELLLYNMREETT